MMPVVLYYYPLSPPCRSVLLLGKMLEINFDLREVNPLEREQLRKEFTEINPQHTIPTMDDHGFVLWESRVILTYLCAAYGKDDHLYPADVKTRAIIDQRLQFDLGTLYQRMAEYVFPTIQVGAPLDEKKLQRVREALGWLNTLLEGKEWTAANHFTIADLTLCITVGQIQAFGVDIVSFGNILIWLEKCRTELQPFGYEEIVEASAENLGSYFRSKLT